MDTRIVAVFLLVAPAALAQRYGRVYAMPESLGPKAFDLSAFAGYQLNGDASTSGGTLEVKDAPAAGAALDIRTGRTGSLELAWVYDHPDARFQSFGGAFPSSETFRVHSHYFQIGGMTQQPMGKLEPFFGLTVGAALFRAGTIPLLGGGSISTDDTWRFATTAVAGTKIWLSPNFGLRLEMRMLVPVLFESGAVYAGSGGAGMTASAGVPSLQFAFSGGLVFGQ